MYPFWKAVIEPALVAARAQRVVEIGALRGETTVHLLELLGPKAELHVIDPVPIFDPSVHEERFPGRYVFHRDVSHNVLPDLEACDAALVDGDHNWFTVLNELRMLRDAARAANRPLPLLILHDVCWPYGRRDLYYDPERIPEEHRQPHDRQGLMPGRTELVSGHGLNQHLANAVQEGGPRNGVRTGLDDFLEEHDRSFRSVVLPIYYGLALVADQDRLDASPELGPFLSRLESADFRYELMELAEGIRVTEQVGHHDQHYAISHRARRTERLYLDLLKGALLDEHHIENELRIEYLLECIQEGATVSPQKLGDPGRYMTEELRQLREVRRSGELPSEHPVQDGKVAGLTFTEIGRVRLDQLERCLDAITEEDVHGDLVECGTGAGGAAVFMRGYLEAHDRRQPAVWVADRFGGGTSAALEDPPRFPPDLNAVREAFARFDLYDERVRLLQGPPAETLRGAPIGQIALLRVDRHDPDEVRAILEALYDKVTLGGFVLIDDYGAPECREAVEAFRADRSVREPVERTDWSGALWRKTTDATRSAPATSGEMSPTESPPATARKDLSVVLVFHNMRREAARTLHSLSRNYQQGIEALDYEVVVVENGSTDEQRLGEEFVRGFGKEFRYIDLGDEAHPSPARAINRGLAESGSGAVALMIDGAHVLSPGVLQLGMLGLNTYGPAVVTTQQWYVGPGQQNEAVAKGYDRDYEDALFEQIGWPTDGYRLFDISHFIGGRDWFDDQWESNCIFASRPMVERAGRLDESFGAPGGGFVNLDFFERMASSPGVTLVSILGEGSFHQLHGGTTTNLGGDDERTGLIAEYGRQYAELRGRRFRTPSKEVHYVGSLPERARRTRPRRMRAPAFKLTHTRGTDGRPRRPVPVPEDVRLDFTDAFWQSEEWQQTTWLGKWIGKAPTDLLAYQDLAYRVRPRWIVETGTGGGGRAFYLASVFDLIGTGRVLSIDDYAVDSLMEHPRITYLRGDPADPAIAAEAHALVGQPANTLLILGLAGIDDLMATFRAYEQLVPVGGYVVVEDTIVNGHPVWTGFGPGPFEAARRIVTQVGGFAPDTSYERYGLTFNPGGFLRRIAT